jgi:Protein of unknown function (DUF2783)
MAKLNIDANVESPDELYQSLLDAHRGLTLDQSQALNARLVLLLANHIGDLAVLRDALRRARDDVESNSDAATSASAST